MAAKYPHLSLCAGLGALLLSAVISALIPSIARACSGEEIQAVGSENYFPLAYGDHPTAEQLMALGRKLFFDTGLSASGKLACSTCHDPKAAYGPPNNFAIQFGGENMRKMGFRNTPSLS